MNKAFIEAEISDSTLHAPILYEESAVASHASQHFLERLNLAYVPEPRYEHTSIGRCDHLLQGLGIIRWREHNVDWHFPHFIRQREAVPRSFSGTNFVTKFRTPHAGRC